jgi:hypothetical protein
MPHHIELLAALLALICAGTWLLVKLAGAREVLVRIQPPAAGPAEDPGVDILTPASSWHPADDGLGADFYQPEPPVTYRRTPGALYVRSCSHGRHRS